MSIKKADNTDSAPLLQVENLCMYFKSGKGEMRAVDNVSFTVEKGEVFGLVGESGCGKTTTGRSIIKIYDVTSGNIYFNGRRISAGTKSYREAIERAKRNAELKILDLRSESRGNTEKKVENDKRAKEIKAELSSTIKRYKNEIKSALYDTAYVDKKYAVELARRVDEKYLPLLKAAKEEGDKKRITELKKEYTKERRIAKGARLLTKIQMIFQDPVASLNPRMTVREIISEGLVIRGVRDKEYIDAKVYEMLRLVGLAREHAGRYPHEFSGGQKQRIGIARSIIMNPELIIADEPISALDVSIQAQVINLLNDLKEKLGLTVLFVAHDLSVVKYFSDRIGVMYLGRIVELAETDELFAHPLHPYTKALLSAIPIPDPITERKRERLIYNPIKEHNYTTDAPSMREIYQDHYVFCNDKEEMIYKKEIEEWAKKVK